MKENCQITRYSTTQYCRCQYLFSHGLMIREHIVPVCYFGKRRLFERISPKKSWEGSIGGGVFSIIAAIVMAHYFPFMPISIWIGLALTVVIFGTLGDLTESLLKRTIGIKDYRQYITWSWRHVRSL